MLKLKGRDTWHVPGAGILVMSVLLVSLAIATRVGDAQAFPGETATTLSEYYLACGKPLPSLANRGQIFQTLGLGAASSYTGSIGQNTVLLNALKARQICPATASEIPLTDSTVPTVNSFSVTPGSVTLGGSFHIAYSVSDSGGSNLNRVELWRAGDSAGSPTGWVEVKRVSISGTSSSSSFTDTPSLSGSYWYGVHAVDNAGSWAPEASPVKVTVTPLTAPSAPLNLQATAEDGSVNLSWNAPSNNGGSAVTGYRLYRGTSSDGASFYSNVDGTTYQDIANVTNGTTYYYKVTAVNSAGESAFSNEAIATPPGGGSDTDAVRA